MKFTIVAILFSLFSLFSTAQTEKAWTLEDCLNHVETNHPRLLQADSRIQISQIDGDIQKRALLPNIQFNTDLGAQLGQNINPSTNTFENQTVGYNYFQVDGSWEIPNRKEQGLIKDFNSNQVKGQELAKKQLIIDLKIQTIQAFMSIILAEEQIEMTNNHLDLLAKQLSIIDASIDAGHLPRKNRLEVILNQAQSNQNLSKLKNDVSLYYNQLRRILGIAADAPLIVQEISQIDITEKWNQIHFDPTGNMENYIPLKMKYNDIANAKISLDLLKTEKLPSMILFANIGTRYSSSAKEVDGYDEEMVEQPVKIGGVETVIETPQYSPIFNTTPYFNQIKNNFGQNIGFRFTLPIWNKTFNLSQEQKRLEFDLAVQEINLAKQEFDTEYANAYQDLTAQKEYFELTKKRLDITKERMVINEKELKMGAGNILNLILTQRELEAASNDVIVAKWTFIFKYSQFENRFLK